MKFLFFAFLSMNLLSPMTYAQEAVELNSSNYRMTDEKVFEKDDKYIVKVKCKSGDREFEGEGTSMDMSFARQKASLDCRAKVAQYLKQSGGGSRVECRPLKDSSKVFNASTPACGRIEFCVMQVVCTNKSEPVKVICRTNSQGECPEASDCQKDESFAEVLQQMDKGSLKLKKSSGAKGE